MAAKKINRRVKRSPSPQPSPPRRGSPGPKPSITLDVVKRVSRRFGIGIPLVEALAAEGNDKINLETWKKALQAHPEFSPHYAAAKGKFLDTAMERLIELDQIQWLLERRRPDLFARPAAVAVSVNNTTNIVGLPDDVLERARKLARDEAKPTGAKDGQ